MTLTLQQVADLFRTDTDEIDRLTTAGEFTPTDVDGERRFPESTIREFMTRNTVTPTVR